MTGKIAFIQKVEQDIKTNPDTTIFDNLPVGTGCRFVYNGIQFLTNYDGSQDEGDINNDDVLRQFFEPFEGLNLLNARIRFILLQLMKVALLDFFQDNRADFPHLFQQIHTVFERDLPHYDERVLIVNLNFRAVVADNEDEVSIFDQMIGRMTAPALWEKCQQCDIANQCYVNLM